MKRHLKISLSCLMLFTLTACSTLTNWVEGEDNLPQPKELTPIDAEKTVIVDRQLHVSQAPTASFMNLKTSQQGELSVIVDNKGVLSAVNRTNGELVWRNTAIKNKLISGPTVGEGVVIVASQAGEVIAISAADGVELWRTQLNREILATAAIDKQHVIVKTTDDQVQALSLADGQLIWQYKHGSTGIGLRVSSAPVISDKYVIVGFADGRLDVLELATGTLIWQRPMAFPKGISLSQQIVGIVADPLVENGIIYVATYQNKLAAIELTTGRDLWQREMSVYAGMTLDAQALYITDAKGQIWAINKRDGEVLWQQDELMARGLTAPVAMEDSIVVVDSFAFVHWLAKNDGRLVARLEPQAAEKIVGQPLVADQRLYVLKSTGDITQLMVAQ